MPGSVEEAASCREEKIDSVWFMLMQEDVLWSASGKYVCWGPMCSA